jgi:phage tail tube protein FII
MKTIRKALSNIESEIKIFCNNMEHITLSEYKESNLNSFCCYYEEIDSFKAKLYNIERRVNWRSNVLKTLNDGSESHFNKTCRNEYYKLNIKDILIILSDQETYLRLEEGSLRRTLYVENEINRSINDINNYPNHKKTNFIKKIISRFF